MLKSFKRVLGFFVVLALIIGNTSFMNIRINAQTMGITDLDKCAPYSKEAVTKLVSEGIISGGTDGTFNPRGTITRAQVIKLIIEVLELPLYNPPVPTFRDLSKSHWAYRYVETAYKERITAGIAPDMFGPDRYCSREEMVAMLIRAYKMESSALAKKSGGMETLNGFEDRTQISPWAVNPMAMAHEDKLIVGYDGKISPKEYASREQTAVIINRYLFNLHDNIAQGMTVEMNRNSFVINKPQRNFIINVRDITDSQGNVIKLRYEALGNLPNYDPTRDKYTFFVTDDAASNGRVYPETHQSVMNEEVFRSDELYTLRISITPPDGFTTEHYIKARYSPLSEYVKSVTAANVNELVVSLGWRDMDYGRKINADNYTITDSNGNTIPIRGISHDSWDDYVYISLAEPMMSPEKVTLEIRNMYDNKGNPLPDFINEVFCNDITPPAIIYQSFGADSKNADLWLRFNEYVTGTMVLDGRLLKELSDSSVKMSTTVEGWYDLHRGYIFNVTDGRNITPLLSFGASYYEPYVSSVNSPVKYLSYTKAPSGRVDKITINLNEPVKNSFMFGKYHGSLDIFDSNYNYLGTKIEYGYSAFRLSGEAVNVNAGTTKIVIPISKDVNMYKGTYKIILPGEVLNQLYYNGYGRGEAGSRYEAELFEITF